MRYGDWHRNFAVHPCHAAVHMKAEEYVYSPAFKAWGSRCLTS